ncbi:MAG: histidine phosphatase family protein [Gemmatimonadaceae bacterium]
MKLLVIRHAIAMDREEFAKTGQPDDMRPLTRGGTAKMEANAKGLRREIGELDQLATSPLTRALQTAKIVSDVFGIGGAEVTDSLMPDAPPEDFEKWCDTIGQADIVAIVGHEPHLSSLVTWLLTGHSESRLRIRKGGACLIEFESQPRRDSGTLNWLSTPAQLRKKTRHS